MKNNGRAEFNKDKKEYIRLCHEKGNEDFPLDNKCLFPCLYDVNAAAGSVDEHYFLQDIYMARKIKESGVSVHYDIGSRLDGFISHLLVVGINVKMLDIRPLNNNIEGLDFVKADATEMDVIADNSISSLSSLHAIEHFGLGRYGDKIDPDAWKTALQVFQRKLVPGGYLYLSVPVGSKQKLMFNAHRIFIPTTIANELSELKLCSFAYIHNNTVTEAEITEMVPGEYDCGLFIFQKL